LWEITVSKWWYIAQIYRVLYLNFFGFWKSVPHLTERVLWPGWNDVKVGNKMVYHYQKYGIRMCWSRVAKDIKISKKKLSWGWGWFSWWLDWVRKKFPRIRKIFCLLGDGKLFYLVGNICCLLGYKCLLLTKSGHIL